MAHNPILCHMEEGYVIDRTFIAFFSSACALSEGHKVYLQSYLSAEDAQCQGQESTASVHADGSGLGTVNSERKICLSR